LTGSETPKRIIIDKEKKVTGKFIRNQTVTALNCSAATNNGTLTSGVAVSGVVNIVIPYSGAFGGTHNGQTVTSTGVTGLTATLAAGTFAIGSGNLTYTITGTPSAEGIASFAINIGGQTCALTRSVSAPPPSITSGDVINPKTGKIWMDRNLGASRVATSSTDVDSYGDLYQWGRGADGHQKRTSATTTTRSSTDVPGNGNFIVTSNNPYDWRSTQNDNLWQGVNGINNPCPAGYRLPTIAEWEAELESWSPKNADGAYASPLKLPMAGARGEPGNLWAVDKQGQYWSSTVIVNNVLVNSIRFGGPGYSTEPFNNHRVIGYSVRCIKN
jgi:uncharacterized protein (TIGR02145 family)